MGVYYIHVTLDVSDKDLGSRCICKKEKVLILGERKGLPYVKGYVITSQASHIGHKGNL